MLYFIIFFVVDLSLGRTPPDPRRAEERWLDQCRLYAGTWQRSWTGIWLSAKSPWTAAVHRQRMMFIWMVSMIISPEKKNSWHYCPEDNSEGRWHLRMFFVENKVPFEKPASQTGLPPWRANMQTSLRYAEVTHTSQNVYVTTESFTSRRSVQKWPASIMWCLPSWRASAPNPNKSGHSVCCWRSWWLSRRWVCSVFFCLFLSEIKEFMRSKGEEASLEMS